MSQLSSRWKQWASYLRVETYTLYYLIRHPGVPWYARLAAVLVVGYAFSPIDLIPDFIPVLGYLDDLILLPLGVYLTLKLVPAPVLAECRQQAAQKNLEVKPTRWAAVVIVAIWVVAILAAAYFLWLKIGTRTFTP
jgi:uncharacterized membrane protein YkvA (DUF1232 family)